MTSLPRPGTSSHDLEHLHCGDVDWNVDPRLADQLLGPDGLRWEQWRERGWLQTVKSGRHRSVHRVTLPGGVYYVKHFRAADRWARWRRRLRGAIARKEWQAAARVRQLGIPTFEVVAVGGPRGRGHDTDSLLVSRAIPDARPLDELISSGGISRVARREILLQVAETVARLHDGGVWHGDLHAGNFLVQIDSDDRVAVWLIDLHRVRYCRPTARLRLRQLGQLAAALGHVITRTDHIVFLRHYLSASQVGSSGQGSFHETLTRLQRVFQRCRANGWKRLDRQWARGNRRLLIADVPGIRCRGLAALGKQQLEHLRNRLAADPPPEGTRLPLATGHGMVATIVHRLDSQGDCSAHEAWELGHALKRRGLPVVAPWLYVETSQRGLVAIMVPDAVVPLSEASVSDQTERDAKRILRRVDASGLGSGRIGPSHLLLDRENRSQPLVLLPTWRGWNHRPARRTGAAAVVRLIGFSLAWLLSGCLPFHTLQNKLTHTLSGSAVSVTPPARHSVRSKRFTILSDLPLQQNHWLIQDLELLERQLVESLGLSESGREVTVYVFASRREYELFLETSFPQLPTRRAYFVGTPQQLAVYTFWGDKIQEDLRHEFTHGILHSSLPHVPLWLDEGLAEYFEVVGPEPGGINAEFADRLAASAANGWQPDLKRLERLEAVGEMQRVDYEQAWAWIHFLMHGPSQGRSVLRDHLQALADQPRVEPLSSRLKRRIPNAGADLLVYIRGGLTSYRRPVSR